MGLQPFRYDRDWIFPVEPAGLWDVVSDSSQWPRWSRWLGGLRLTGTSDLVEDGRLRRRVVTGSRAECRIQGPVPYALSIDVLAREVVPGRLVDAVVRGDLVGEGRVELLDHPGGTCARVTWEVELRPPALRLFARVARPLMEWAHDRVVDDGIRRFRRQLVAERPPGGRPPCDAGG